MRHSFAKINLSSPVELLQIPLYVTFQSQVVFSKIILEKGELIKE